jgi:hypothetical protein
MGRPAVVDVKTDPVKNFDLAKGFFDVFERNGCHISFPG